MEEGWPGKEEPYQLTGGLNSGFCMFVCLWRGECGRLVGVFGLPWPLLLSPSFLLLPPPFALSSPLIALIPSPSLLQTCRNAALSSPPVMLLSPAPSTPASFPTSLANDEPLLALRAPLLSLEPLRNRASFSTNRKPFGSTVFFP